MFCSECGAQLASRAAFCGACGAEANVQAAGTTARARPGQPKGDTGRSSAATALMVVAIVLGSIMFIGIVAAIAVPGLLRARIAANEASAIGSMRAIVSAEVAYFSTAGKGGYATRLTALSKPCPGSSDSFIAPDLSQDPSVKNGYMVKLESAAAAAGPADCNGSATEADYYASAVPVSAGTTGMRAFSTSAGGEVFFDLSGPAPSRAATLGRTAMRVQ